MHTLKNESACEVPPLARGAGSPSPGDLAATGAQVPKAPVALFSRALPHLCMDCGASIPDSVRHLLRYQCWRCAGNS
jgi:hypothetical protein